MRSKVSPEIKAAALADLLSGEQPAIVAARYGLSAATVRSWKRRDATPLATERATVATTAMVRYPTIEQQQERIVALVYELLSAKLEASKRIAEHATQSEWLARQSAEGIAELGTYLDQTAAGILSILARRPDAGD